MRNTIKFQIIVVFAIFFSSCSDLLNTVPQDFLAPKTYMNDEKEAFLVLTSVYDPISVQQLYGKNYSIDMQNDDLSFQNRPITSQSVLWNNPTNADGTVLSAWNTLWDGITRANLFLSMIDKPVMDSTKREQFRAEALFLRSFYYYQLVCSWGDVPLRLEVIKDLNKVQIARTPAHLVLKQVVKDMETAESSVGKANDNTVAGSRITQSCVQGILARVYLTMAGAMFTDEQLSKKAMYEKALYWSYQVKKSALHTLNNKTVTLNYADLGANKPAGGYQFLDLYRRYAADELDTDFRETIWEAMMMGDSQSTYQEGQWISTSYGPSFAWNVLDHPAYYSYAFYYSTNTLWNLFAKDLPTGGADLRLNTALVPYTFKSNAASVTSRNQIDLTVLTNDETNAAFSSTRCIGKYLRQFEKSSSHSKNFSPCNFPLLRYSDVLLMIAEAGIQTRNLGGTTPAEITDINKEIYDCVKSVRDRAGVGETTPLTFNTIDFIIDERARELCFEGLRKQDLLRWGIYIDRMYATKDEMVNAAKGVAAAHKTLVSTTFGNISLRSKLWPIPSTEISLNPLMTQNFGW